MVSNRRVAEIIICRLYITVNNHFSIYVIQVIRFLLFSQGALKLKIALKASKKEDADKAKCEKPRRPTPRRSKATNRSAKVSPCFNKP